ncbi:MAG TPA: hypothetical protein VFI54_26690 [Solirubrobacteraceae bacterium]|nr:hypothetical protein [Solirubrobacteraceae bacterium]
MSDESEGRVARNESVAREVNEAIEHGRGPADVQAPLAFRCECGRLGCNTLIEVTMGEYERVRSHPRQFLVATGHEQTEFETVVRAGETYSVVEKQDEAGRLAEARDPRS